MTPPVRQLFIILLIPLVILVAVRNVVSAEIIDIRDLERQTTQGQPVAGFYAITPDGKTRPIDPVKSGLATSGNTGFTGGGSGSEAHKKILDSGIPPDQKPAKEKSSRDKPRKVRIRITRKPPERNLADQFQCERHGFYYTNDGRCILPAYGHLPVKPHLLPSPRIPPMKMD